MNYSNVANQLGKLLVIFGVCMAGFAIVALAFEEFAGEGVDVQAVGALLIGAACCLVAGGGAWFATRRGDRFLGRREALLLVVLSWILGALFAALPFWFWALLPGEAPAGHPFRSFENCYFEATSGLTTTGATILSDIEAVPREILMWRAFTHWIGGLGIVVLFVLVLPSLGVGGKRLFKAEAAAGPAPGTLQAQLRGTARVLLLIYVSLTVLEVLALWTVGRMTLYDSICHAFSNVASGGLSPRNASIGAYYDRPAVDVIVIVFTVLSGVNYGLYFLLWQRRVSDVWRNSELRLYLGCLIVASVLVSISLATSRSPLVLTTGETIDATVTESIRQGVFTSASIQTGTGFCTTDFDRWPFPAHAVLFTIMFIGGCSGSTTGGLKVIRVWICLRVLASELEHFVRPRVARPIMISGSTVDRRAQLAAMIYAAGIIVLFATGWVTVMLLEQLNPAGACSSVTAASASVASLCNVGPGFGGVGAIDNYGWMTGPSKLVLSLLMAVGRIEIFPFVVLLLPGFWRSP